MKNSFLKHLAAFAILVSTTGISSADTITVAVASNFTMTMKKLVKEFESQTGHKVNVAYGSSGRLYAQIINGAPFDVFFSADQQKPVQLEQDGLIEQGSRFTYARGALALWTSNQKVANDPLAQLQSGDFNKLAIANPKLAPYGKAAVETLKKLDLNETTKSKWVVGENIAQTHQFASTGNADLGFIALSQIMNDETTFSKSAHNTALWIVPTSYHQPINQDVVILKKGKAKTSQEFLNYIKSENGKNIIRSMGYQVD